MDDCLGEFLARFIFQCVWALTVVKIGNHIARHQHLIIRRVLQLQGLFRVPKCIQIFSEDDHAIPETDTKICAGLLTCCFILSSLITVGMLLGRRSWGGITPRLMLVLTTVNSPFCILLWIILAVSARRRAKDRRRQARLVTEPYQGTKAQVREGIGKPMGDIAATTLAINRSTPKQQPLRWKPDELSIPSF